MISVTLSVLVNTAKDAAGVHELFAECADPVIAAGHPITLSVTPIDDDEDEAA